MYVQVKNMTKPRIFLFVLFKWKIENMSRFTLQFSFQYLEISIEISKYWYGNSMVKRAEIPVFHLNYIYNLNELMIRFFKSILLVSLEYKLRSIKKIVLQIFNYFNYKYFD